MSKSLDDFKRYVEQSRFFAFFSWLLPGNLKKIVQKEDDASIQKALLEMKKLAPFRMSLFSGIRRYMDKFKLEKTLSYGDFSWSSSEIKKKEWDYAKKKLSPNGKLLPDGTKLRRKSSENMLEHSFIIIDQTILAMAPRRDYLGEGASAKAKLGEDEDGGLWAIKIRRIGQNNQHRVVPDSPGNEEKIAFDLSKALKATNRMKSSYLAGFFGDKQGKHYLATVFLGQTLDKYLKEQQLSDDQRYALAIKITGAVHALHSGEHSKNGLKYMHGDLNSGNITIDAKGDVHLIDHGSSLNISGMSKTEYETNCRLDVSRLVDLIKVVFTQEMKERNNCEISTFLNSIDSYYSGQSHIPLALELGKNLSDFQQYHQPDQP
jgi:hypothetical protein